MRIPRLRHNRIRLDEATQHGVVIPSAVEVQPDCSILPLAGKAEAGGRTGAAVARLAPEPALNGDDGSPVEGWSLDMALTVDKFVYEH